jgi:predicted protein tyrosine phosphatase
MTKGSSGGFALGSALIDWAQTLTPEEKEHFTKLSRSFISFVKSADDEKYIVKPSDMLDD